MPFDLRVATLAWPYPNRLGMLKLAIAKEFQISSGLKVRLIAPYAVAVLFEDKQLTYRQLNERANQLACYLQG